MTKAPGHRKWPDHTVREARLDRKMRIEANGEVIADSADVIQLDEDEHPRRYYFPRSDVVMSKLEPSERTTDCPFKGTARYFDVRNGEEVLEDAAWSYEDPYEEHRDLKDRIAFHETEMDEIEVRSEQ